MEPGKSLSKNLLYTPWEAYFQTSTEAAPSIVAGKSHSKKTGGGKLPDKKNTSNNSTGSYVPPSQYYTNQRQSSVPMSLHESTLASFLQFVSHDYHRNWATPHDAKNNSSRPLSLKDVDDRIKQRAVTLVGGGINAPIAISKNSTNTTKKRRRRRRQCSWEQVKDKCQKWCVENSIEPLCDITFLREMNRGWNDYLWNLLELSTDDLSCLDSEEGVQRLQQRWIAIVIGGGRNTKYKNYNANNFELVGGHVKIDSCHSHKAWIGRHGVVIGETQNTYRIACLASTSRKQSKMESIVGDDNDDNVSVIVVPKQGTALMLLLPVPPAQNFLGSIEDHAARHEHDGVLIPVSDKTICITLSDSYR
jgi:hypothetical protein